MSIEEFKRELLLSNNIDKRILLVQKYFFHGTPFVFNGRENEYFEFRQKIAEKFSIGFYEVFIVGSAKLGFSHFKSKPFSYDSDVDVVLVNETLFEKYFNKITDYQYKLDRTYRDVNVSEIQMYHSFLRYLVKGWMRPDKLPTSFQIDMLKTDWFDFFDSISNGKSEVGNYKVAAGLFKNYDYLQKYYIQSVEDQYAKLKME